MALPNLEGPAHQTCGPGNGQRSTLEPRGQAAVFAVPRPQSHTARSHRQVLQTSRGFTSFGAMGKIIIIVLKDEIPIQYMLKGTQ